MAFETREDAASARREFPCRLMFIFLQFECDQAAKSELLSARNQQMGCQPEENLPFGESRARRDAVRGIVYLMATRVPFGDSKEPASFLRASDEERRAAFSFLRKRVRARFASAKPWAVWQQSTGELEHCA